MQKCDICKRVGDKVGKVDIVAKGLGRCQICLMKKDNMTWLETNKIEYDLKIKCPECPYYGASIQNINAWICTYCYDRNT